jgi:hypothetical protein
VETTLYEAPNPDAEEGEIIIPIQAQDCRVGDGGHMNDLHDDDISIYTLLPDTFVSERYASFLIRYPFISRCQFLHGNSL